MRYVVCTAIALICTNLHAQTPPARPRFEVASVKPAANDETGFGRIPMMREMMRNGRRPGMIPMTDPGRIRLENWALLDLIAAAYSVRATQVSGAAWRQAVSQIAPSISPPASRRPLMNSRPSRLPGPPSSSL